MSDAAIFQSQVADLCIRTEYLAINKHLLGLQNFSISEQELISKAKQVFDTESGQKDSSVLSDDFRFEFPIVSLSKEVGQRQYYLDCWSIVRYVCCACSHVHTMCQFATFAF